MRSGTPLLKDLRLCLGFFSVLPWPLSEPAGGPDALAGFPRAVRMLPAAGGVIGAFAAAAMAGALALGFPPPLAAPIAVLILVYLSGGMHEDGLADCADGFFGAACRQRKLEIMQDSRIGAFGAIALIFSLYLRTASLALITAKSPALAAAVLTGGAAISRTAALLPLACLPPARNSGAGFAAGKPELRALFIAVFLAVIFGLIPALAGAVPLRLLLAAALPAAAALAVTFIAKIHIGGQTGDVAGAAQQIAETVYFLAYAVHL
ncbi:MAG TPA: adenosylcobinamide-GDP ribazoletransferase [Methylocella sp.]|nr:adenosylcobinamide-GDP ribazoletransferase [Methylocella sp.]